jgi:excisionase family DNA binding protein
VSLQRRFKKPEPISFVGARLLTPEQAATYVCRSIDVMYEMIHSREIPHVKNGRRYTVDRVDLDKWIEKNKEGKAA